MPNLPRSPLVAFSVLVFGLAATSRAQNPVGRDAVPTKLVVYDLASESSRVARTEPRRLGAPSWTPDGKSWLVNSGGKIERVPTVGAGPLEPIAITGGGWIDVDHGVAPDGGTLAFTGSNRLALAPTRGGAVTPLVPTEGSYFHSWSPDGTTVYFSARRNNNLDLYSTDRAGGPERRLTTNPASDDTAAASADGRWIYFASNRSGRMKIWRLPTSGTEAQAEQVTFDDRNDNAPHPSPDGKFLIYQADQPGPGSYLPDHEITIRKLALPADGVKLGATTSAIATEEVARFVGGHKSLGASPWSSDSLQFVYAAFDYPAPRVHVVFLTPPGMTEPAGVTDRLTLVADAAERFLLGQMKERGYPAAVAQIFDRTAQGQVEILRVAGPYPQGDPRYLDPKIRAAAIQGAQSQGQVAGEGHVWWIFAYLGSPPTRFATWQGSNEPEPEAYAIVNYDDTPGAIQPAASLAAGFNKAFALKGAIHELGHAFGLFHIGPDLGLGLGNSLMGPNNEVYKERGYSKPETVSLTEASAALLWKHPIFSGTTVDRFHQPEGPWLTSFKPVSSRTTNKIIITGQVAAMPLPHSVSLQDDLGRPNDPYWHPTQTARVAPNGTFQLTIDRPTRADGHYRIFFAFPNGMVTGGGPDNDGNRDPQIMSYRFRNGTYQVGG